MRCARPVIGCLLGFFLACSFAQTQAPRAASLFAGADASKSISHVVATPRVRAELMADAPDGVQVGKPLTLGLQLQHQAGWHTYWKNPGDSGLPTQLQWTLPAGVTASAIQWPVPQKIPVANLANYGYEGTVLLAVPATVSSGFQAVGTEMTVHLKAQWLVCKTECIPEEGEFVLKLPVRGSAAIHRASFDSAQASLPKAHQGEARFSLHDKTLKLTAVGLPAAWQGKPLEAFPEDAEIIETAAKPEQTWAGGQWTGAMRLHAQRTNSPAKMAWLLKPAGGQNHAAVRVEALLDGVWPAAALAKPLGISPALDAALAQSAANALDVPAANWMSATYGLAILGALLGGLILNLMPCVLPVLAIKLLSFTPKKASTASVVLPVRASSGLFALGVVGAFVLLGGLLLLLRGAGQSLGWGFQLQSPAMVLSLALLFLFIGLNLWGLFDVRLLLPTSVANFQSNNPRIESLASGVLAVLIATPCTAPFMGASLGLAMTLPTLQALLIFLALGLGMALPFILIALFPSTGVWLLKVLPKPGAWMQTLRRWLALPMFVTAAWLVWVFAVQINAATASTQAVPAGNQAHETVWQSWSLEKQVAARATGRAVFVDFTAAWCITCQVNKSTTLGSAEIEAAFQAKNVLLLRADWTAPNAAIAAELARLGRSGLPVYAYYLPNAAAPLLLPEVLTKAIVLAAL
ncbi:MAG: protein-disulfide reductase DsbD family protein [Cytophagales bacterium]|nr:protein-disulfide reductase DsbD family protein [Cytophagales bacterium]